MTATPDTDRACTPDRFVRILGEGDVHYVQQLKDAGLLVLADDGKQILVEASLQRIRSAPRVEPERTASFAQFARQLGERSSSYVTELKRAGRLALTADGKRVRVDASLALIRATADPSKTGVVARHASNRAAPTPEAAPSSSSPAEGKGSDDWLPPEGGHQLRRAKALADKEEALAAKALRENLVEMGKLLPAEEVEHQLFAAGTTLRTSLENLPNTLAPELAAARDEGRVRVILGEAIEHALEEIARAFSTIAKSEVA